MKEIAIFGAGSWGTALAVQLGSRKIPVLVYGRDSDRVEKINRERENRNYLPGITIPGYVEFTSDIGDLDSAETVVLTVPSQEIRGAVRQLNRSARKKRIYVNTAKGFEQQTNLRLSGVIAEEADSADGVCILSGPSHAEEVARFLPTAIVSSSEDPSVAEEVQNLFMAESLRVYTNEDLCGVEIGGAVKNIIALAAGANAGLGFGDNSTAALMTRGLYEMVKFGKALGAQPETFYGLTGLGDLIVTCNSTHSRNRRCGFRLGRGEKLEEILQEINMAVEGIVTARATFKWSGELGVDMPITREVYSVLFEGKEPRQSVMDLMTREKKEEIMFK